MKSWTLTLVAAGVLLAAPAARAADSVDASALGEPIAGAADAGVEDAATDMAEASDAAGAAEDAAGIWEVDRGDEATADVAPAATPEPADEVAAPMALAEPAVSEPVASEPVAERVRSGAPAADAQGRRGVIHVVVKGDTLWAISDTYLETPWVWPSIWQENAEIANPHLIYPGDHIWISSTEMRKVTPAEAAEMIAAESELAVVEPPAALGDEPSEIEIEDVPAALDEMDPVAAVPAPAVALASTIRIPGVDVWSFVSEDQLEGATSIVSSASPRTYLSQTDTVVLGLGEGETRVGQQYDIFTNADPVRDPETGRVLGYYVDVVGWVEVKRIEGDASVAEIRQATSEIVRGARVIEREPMPSEFAAKTAPTDLEGRIVYMPKRRTQMANLDYVFLDRGSVHGLEIGSQIVAYEAGRLRRDAVRGVSVREPDYRVAELVIVSVQPTTSVAYVLEARRELQVGDAIRSPVKGAIVLQ